MKIDGYKQKRKMKNRKVAYKVNSVICFKKRYKSII